MNEVFVDVSIKDPVVRNIWRIPDRQMASPSCGIARGASSVPISRRNECMSCRHEVEAYQSLGEGIWLLLVSFQKHCSCEIALSSSLA